MDEMYAKFVEGDIIGAASLAPKALDIDIPDRVWVLARQVTSKLNKDDFKALFKFGSNPKVIDGLPDFLETVGKIEPDDLAQLKGAMKKINPQNVAEIDLLLSDLGVSMFEFISNPTLLVKFFRDPTLAVTLTKIRGLLPIFESSDLNAMIKMQKVFASSPKAGFVLKAALGLPLTLTGKLTSVEIGPDDFEMMKALQVGKKQENYGFL
jgi:hypothetical protein